MKSSEARRLEMFIRVRQFGTRHADKFPADTRGGELFAQLGAVIAELEGHATTQESGARGAKEGTALKAVARAALREDLEAISRTARAMALSTPGLDDKFRLPRGGGDQALLAAARAVATEAAPLKTEFTRRGMPADFLEDLAADIEALDESIDARAERRGARVAATAAIDESIERGTNVVRELDAVVQNIFRDVPAALAEWTSASHTARDSRRADAETTRPAAPPAPAGA